MYSAHQNTTNLTPHTLLPSVAPTGQSEVRFRGCGSGWSSWYTWYTFAGTRGTPWDGVNGFSRPKNPQFDLSQPFVAPTDQKLDSEGVAVGGAPGTRGTHAQGLVIHLGMVYMDSADPKTQQFLEKYMCFNYFCCKIALLTVSLKNPSQPISSIP